MLTTDKLSTSVSCRHPNFNNFNNNFHNDNYGWFTIDHDDNDDDEKDHNNKNQKDHNNWVQGNSIVAAFSAVFTNN